MFKWSFDSHSSTMFALELLRCIHTTLAQRKHLKPQYSLIEHERFWKCSPISTKLVLLKTLLSVCWSRFLMSCLIIWEEWLMRLSDYNYSNVTECLHTKNSCTCQYSIVFDFEWFVECYDQGIYLFFARWCKVLIFKLSCQTSTTRIYFYRRWYECISFCIICIFAVNNVSSTLIKICYVNYKWVHSNPVKAWQENIGNSCNQTSLSILVLHSFNDKLALIFFTTKLLQYVCKYCALLIYTYFSLGTIWKDVLTVLNILHLEMANFLMIKS